MRLMDRVCRDLARTADAAGRPVLWDDEVRRFGARLNRPGKLSFIIKYVVKGDPRQRLVTLGDFPATAVEAARAEASAIRVAARLGRDPLAEREAAASEDAERRRTAALCGTQVAGLLDGWRAALEAVVADKAARGEGHGYERELLRLGARTIRAEISAEPAGKLDPERFQVLILLQPTINHARNLRNALARFTK